MAALARFLLVGFSGILVNEIVYVALTDNLRVWFVASAFAATAASTTWNFVGNESWSFRGRTLRWTAWLRYRRLRRHERGLAGLRVPMLWVLERLRRAGLGVVEPDHLGALFVLRFAISDGWVWRKKEGDLDSAELGRVGRQGSRSTATTSAACSGWTRTPSFPSWPTSERNSTTPPDIRIRVHRVGALPTSASACGATAIASRTGSTSASSGPTST